MADFVCGTGGWSGPKPGDPDNNSILTATPAFGGIDVSWTYPATNPYAVAHVLLFRGTTSNFAASIQRAVVAGNFFYDKVNTGITYYYWIRIISVNGTPGDLIGPASATARPLIADLIEQLTGQIDAGVLAQSLKTDIDKITLNYGELTAEIANRISGNAALSAALAAVQSGVDDAMAFVYSEITTRTNGDTALANQMNIIAAVNVVNAAAIITEQTTRVTADSAMADSITTIAAANATNAAAVVNIETSKIGYSVQLAGSAPYDGDGVTIVYPASTYPAIDYPAYAVNRTRIIDAVGVALWNATPAGALNPLLWLVGFPLASSVKRIGVTGPDGASASLENAFVAQKNLNGDFKAMYTAKVTVNGLIGGFGIYNDGVVVEAGFDVDTFWIGRTAANKRKPFIIVGSETFIDEAVINHLTFSKLRDEAGTFIVENGQVKASYIDTKGLVIRDIYGNPIFSAGTGLDWSYLTSKPPFGALALADNVSYSGVTGTKPPTNADNTASNTAAGIAGQGALATANSVFVGSTVKFADGSTMATADFVNKLTKIGTGNIGTFIDGLAITNAYIGNAAIQSANIVDAAVTNAKIGDAAITSAKIGDLQVGTLKIADNAVTIPLGVSIGAILESYTGAHQWAVNTVANGDYSTVAESGYTLYGASQQFIMVSCDVIPPNSATTPTDAWDGSVTFYPVLYRLYRLIESVGWTLLYSGRSDTPAFSFEYLDSDTTYSGNRRSYALQLQDYNSGRLGGGKLLGGSLVVLGVKK